MRDTAPGWVLRSGEDATRDVRLAAAPFAEPPAVTLLGYGATEAALRGAAPAAAALHIALPFRLNSASPLFSPLLTSEAARTAPAPADTAAVPVTSIDASDNGVLEARELMNLVLTARLAVLSDRAALSMRDAAAATGTLQWAWRAAGVPSLILPRWATKDERPGQALLADVHARVAEGEAPEAALHAARAAVRLRAATRAPWFWAQFMAVGRPAPDPRPR